MSPTNAQMLTSTESKEQPPFYASRASEIQSPPAYSSTTAGSSSASTAAVGPSSLSLAPYPHISTACSYNVSFQTQLPPSFKINGRDVTPRPSHRSAHHARVVLGLGLIWRFLSLQASISRTSRATSCS